MNTMVYHATLLNTISSSPPISTVFFLNRMLYNSHGTES